MENGIHKLNTGDSSGKFDETMFNHIKIITLTHYATLTKTWTEPFEGRRAASEVRWQYLQ
jgi:hypothetical protein